MTDKTVAEDGYQERDDCAEAVRADVRVVLTVLARDVTYTRLVTGGPNVPDQPTPLDAFAAVRRLVAALSEGDGS